MFLHAFDFVLPDGLIARYPLPQRSASRLLCLDKHTAKVTHRSFIDLLERLSPNDLLVFNNTKVIPARWFGVKRTGGRVEVLVDRILDTSQLLAHVRASKSPKAGSELILEGEILFEVVGRQEDLFFLKCLDQRPVMTLLETYGHMPLPPYMDRPDELQDRARYQTIYASQLGAVAAPTAGLHFDAAMLQALEDKGISKAFLTLHIGAGTFQPVREAIITDHRMHAEYLEVPQSVCDQVRAAKNRGGRVIAVGTTSVRALETAAQTGHILPYVGDTRLFIYPGYAFQCVDAMLTNFHLPKSSLLMLVSAFGGYAAVMEAYAQAIQAKYRFYSYGDAMWID